ncbi:LOW QUALITY PROTEIN: putative poly [ADP-ribose] polymerase 3 [Asparagus officinalis]|uniref:LOW QUALITY PROTEIN: putative poly [ADP-ribose] polymerase 3 n=1 Tax=Asparagus officinalis TaxID=4686 RepID=UPI00098E4738|nr:LOW QUALITY PROTEIN: putative poly [ADP-ribose] polymerase 3 [Asparagus officinalis]
MGDGTHKRRPSNHEDWEEKQAAQPLDAYDVVSDLAPEGKGIPWDKQDPGEEALESLTAELKLYGKRGVHTDSKLVDQGGVIFEKDGIIYNCAFFICDQGRGLNEYCITQLIMVPKNKLRLFYKKGRVGDGPRAEERVEEFPDTDDAIREFVQLFEELIGNEFEPREREKKFEKRSLKFYPKIWYRWFDVRYSGLGVRQLGVAAAYCKLDPLVANFMKVFCSPEVYRYVLMEIGMDSPDLPVGMVSDLHLKRCEELLLQFRDCLKTNPESDDKGNMMRLDFSNRCFTLMHSSRPFTIRDFEELADHAATAFEIVRVITVASWLIGDMTYTTLDDPLSDRYKKLGCFVTPLDKESDDYSMVVKYLEKTYEPVNLGDVSYGATVENIFAVETNEGPSYDDVKKLPNKVFIWCGMNYLTRSSNLMRHLYKGFVPAACSIPAPGYMFGKAIVCLDAAAEAARYEFTAIDRPEGFLVFAVASLGDEITEMKNMPEDIKSLEEKKAMKGVGRKKTDESEHFTWKDNVKVPCGELISFGHDDSLLEYNEYATYDPSQVSIRFLVGVRYEEK